MTPFPRLACPPRAPQLPFGLGLPTPLLPRGACV